MCAECNNNKLTIVELQSQLKQSLSENNEFKITISQLSDKIEDLERCIINLVKLTVL